MPALTAQLGAALACAVVETTIKGARRYIAELHEAAAELRTHDFGDTPYILVVMERNSAIALTEGASMALFVAPQDATRMTLKEAQSMIADVSAMAKKTGNAEILEIRAMLVPEAIAAIISRMSKAADEMDAKLLQQKKTFGIQIRPE
jgi:hypothetical protein